MYRSLIVSSFLALFGTLALGMGAIEAQDAKKIWDNAPHSAFTDLIEWNGKLYCAFRVGNDHVPRQAGDEGRIQLIVSDDQGQTWTDVVTLAEPKIDLRDPKLSVTPDGRLMILFAGSNYDGGSTLKGRDCRVAFGKTDGTFSKQHVIEFDSDVAGDVDWLWRVSWAGDGTGYGVIYQPDQETWGLHLVKTRDGIHYELVKSFDLPGKPNESTIRFDGERMWIVVRNEARNGHFGQSLPPYNDWKWVDVDRRLGGPDIERLPDGRWLMGTREYGDTTRTVYGILPASGKFQRIGALPSGRDTSYPGIVLQGDEVLISYYSGHEGKTSIYLARIPLGDLDPAK
ncbi:MAG: glycoside hydrolase [Mariniblastus sp.]|nr:glycoside hydrolase [Mariniblastus sp.]